MAKKKPKRKPINAKTKATLQKKAAKSKYTYGHLHRSTAEDKVLIYLVVSKSASMAVWPWVE